MSSDVWDIRNRFEQLKGEKQHLEKSLKAARDQLSSLEKSHDKILEAREIIREVGLATQGQLSWHIQDIVSLALASVFPDPYEFEVNFILNRNKTECVLGLVSKDGQKLHPLNATGGGVVDVAAFALRVASCSMQVPAVRPVLILDEPFRYLSTDYQQAAGQLPTEIADKIGYQIICVTHEESLMDVADRVFRVSNSRGKSHLQKN